MFVGAGTGLAKLDEALLAGKINHREAIYIYKNEFQPKILDFSKRLTGGGSKLGASDAQRVEDLVNSLSLLTRQRDQIRAMYRSLIPKGKSDIKKNFVGKILQTKNYKRASDAEILANTNHAIEEAMKSVLKVNKNTSPKDLIRIREEVTKAHAEYLKVFEKEYLGSWGNTLGERAKILATRTFVGGALAATVLNSKVHHCQAN